MPVYSVCMGGSRAERTCGEPNSRLVPPCTSFSGPQGWPSPSSGASPYGGLTGREWATSPLAVGNVISLSGFVTQKYMLRAWYRTLYDLDTEKVKNNRSSTVQTKRIHSRKKHVITQSGFAALENTWNHRAYMKHAALALNLLPAAAGALLPLEVQN